MADEVSKSGVFIDTKSGKVVNSPPEEGVQLVRPGGTIDTATAAAIANAKTAASGETSEPQTVTTDAASGRAAKK